MRVRVRNRNSNPLTPSVGSEDPDTRPEEDRAVVLNGVIPDSAEPARSSLSHALSPTHTYLVITVISQFTIPIPQPRLLHKISQPCRPLISPVNKSSRDPQAPPHPVIFNLPACVCASIKVIFIYPSIPGPLRLPDFGLLSPSPSQWQTNPTPPSLHLAKSS